MTTTQKIPLGYKQTELGVIPEDWDVKKLGDAAEKIVGGGTPSRSNSQYWNGDIPWVTVKDFTTFNPYNSQETITKEGLTCSASHLIPKETLITATRMALGKAVIYKVDVSINQDLKAFFTTKDVNTLFLYYWFQKKAKYIDILGSGSTVKGISLADLRNIAFLRPPKSEQTAIAAVLSDTDTLIEHLEKLIAKKKAIKQGSMQQLLTGKKRLPGFSGEWNEKKLRDIADFLKGRGLSKNKIVNDGTYSCILYGELFTAYTQVIKEVKSKTNTREGLLSIEGDILMPGSTTTVGIDLATASALQQSDILLGGDIIVIRKKESNKYDAEYLAKHLTHISKYKIAEITQGITIIHLHGSRLQEIYVKIPNDRNEQTAIATILSDMDEEIESLEEKRDKYTMLKQGMMQQLMTGKIRIYANN